MFTSTVLSEREISINGKSVSKFRMIKQESLVDKLDPSLIEQIADAAACIVFGHDKDVYYAENKEDAEQAQRIFDAEKKGFKFANSRLNIVEKF